MEAAVVRRAQIEDLNSLRKLCIELYTHYFGDYWEANGLDLYLEEQFATHVMAHDLSSSSKLYFFIVSELKPIGFVKINPHLKIESRENCCELEKMYIHPDFVGRGHGRTALFSIFESMHEMHKKWLFLEVMESNTKGIAFYQQLGFTHFDSITLSYPLLKKHLNVIHRMVLKL